MNIVRFARLISYITSFSKIIPEYQIQDIKNMIEQLNEAPKGNFVDASTVDALLNAMGKEGQKIEAIKQYRTLTGEGLRESKDAVEKYWNR